MDQPELLHHVVVVFERLGAPYLVTGSVATIFYGEPRFTNDIDVVARLPLNRVAEFCASYPTPDFYISEEAVREAISQHGQFNIIHPASGLKVDVIIPPDTPFNRSRFGRATRLRPGADWEATFAAVEDVIIKKMEYYRDGGSEKHLRDITGVLRVSGDRVDHAYIADWSSRLDLESVWRAVLQRLAGE